MMRASAPQTSDARTHNSLPSMSVSLVSRQMRKARAAMGTLSGTMAIVTIQARALQKNRKKSTRAPQGLAAGAAGRGGDREVCSLSHTGITRIRSQGLLSARGAHGAAGTPSDCIGFYAGG